MTFLSWHYTVGIGIYFQRWQLAFKKIIHHFALPVLVSSLFSPWKRLEVEETAGFNIQRIIENITFNIISRSIGFFVRSALILFCLLTLLVQFIFGFLFFIVQIIIPVFGIRDYYNFQNSHHKYIADLTAQLKDNPTLVIDKIFTGSAGRYLISHLGVDLNPVLPGLKVDVVALGNLSPQSFEDIIRWLIASNPDFEPKLRTLSLSSEDLYLAARCWDISKQSQTTSLLPDSSFDYPGIGIELVTGYTPHLNNYTESYNVRQSFSNHLVGRQDVVTRLGRVLQTGKSVLLVGDPGVGKKTVIYEFAHRATRGELDSSLAYSRVLELNYQAILSETTDPNLKKVKLTKLFSEAASAGNCILVLKDLHRLTTSDFEGIDFTDIIGTVLDQGHLKIIAVADTVEYERFLARDSRISKYFEHIEVSPPSKADAMSILIAFAQGLEIKKKIIITAPALRGILDGSDRFITDTPFPEKTLELLEEVVTSKTDTTPIRLDDVNRILSEKTGISMARLTQQEQSKLSNLEEIIHRDLINQSAAVSLISQSLRGRTLGLKSDDRPVGSFLFLGPTGVGKTQTAKVLADVYYGNKNNIIRFDMAEYVGPEGVARLIGSVANNQPGALTTAIKNHPASLLLLDEMEKCPPEIINFFLTLLDEGYIVDATGKKIICRYLFVIATSNAGSEYIRQSVQSGVGGEALQQTVIDHVQKEGIFSPEFLNRFDGVVVYEPLSPENLVKIAHLQLQELVTNLLSKNIYLEFGPDVTQKLATEGYEPAFGARPMRRIIDLTLSDLLGKALLDQQLVDGDHIRLIAGVAKNEYSWQKI